MVRLAGEEVATVADMVELYRSRIASSGYTPSTMFYRSGAQHHLKLSGYGQVLRGLPPGSKVLDLGCGYGAILDYWPPTLDYNGFDAQPQFIEEARRRNPERRFCQSLIEELDINFDWAILVGVLSSTPDPRTLLLSVASKASQAVFFDITLKSRVPDEFLDLNQWSDTDLELLRSLGVVISPVIDTGASWVIFKASFAS